MSRQATRRNLLVVAALIGAALGASATRTTPLKAAEGDPVELRERCAQRVSIALLGTSPSAAMLEGDPKAQVDPILQSPEFVERFSRFANSTMNDNPGDTSVEDSSYHLAKHVLSNGKPWKELFVGGYDVVQAADNGPVSVTENPNGLGYFRSPAWMRRYAGNELDGVRINTAYRILNNTVGVRLTATTNAPGADLSAAGRQAPACKGCHFDSWSALDNVAEVLGKVTRTNGNVGFKPYTGAPKPLLGGAAMVKDDKELVNALVASENFSVNACTLAFRYLYGRPENVCEAAVFDKCVDAFKSTGMLQSGLAAIVNDADFCQ